MAGTTEKTQQPAEWWCNFCDFRTDDEQEYLKHSCKDELAKKKASGPGDAHAPKKDA